MTEQRRIYNIGQRVKVHGYVGRIIAEYIPGMWEVRLDSGDICVPWQDIDPIAAQ